MKKLSLCGLLFIVMIFLIPSQSQAQETNAGDLCVYDENGRDTTKPMQILWLFPQRKLKFPW